MNTTRVLSNVIQMMGVASFAILLIPCFFPLTLASDAFHNSTAFSDFHFAARIGYICGGIGLAFSVLFVRPNNRVSFALTAVGAACAVIGYVPALVSLFVRVSPLAAQCGGFAFGFGMTLLSLAWSSYGNILGFRRFLIATATICLVAVLTNNLLYLCHPLPAVTLLSFFLIISSLQPVIRARHETSGSLTRPPSHPTGAAPRATPSPLTQPTYEASVHLELEGSGFMGKTSLGDLLIVFFTSTMGLTLFTVLANLQIDNPHIIAFFGGRTSMPSLGIAVASLVILLVALIPGKRPGLPFVYWIVFPVIACALLILDSFPQGTPVFSVGATGVFVFFSCIGVFAVAFLLAVNRQGEFPPALSIGISISLLSCAALIGHAVYTADLPFYRGALMLVISTCYFIYLMLTPAIQLWRGRRSNEQVPTSGLIYNEESYRRACDKLSEQFGISTRERDVLYYAGRGYNSSYIAKSLFISDSTVRSHLNSIYRKLNVTSKMEVMRLIENSDTCVKND